MEIENEGKKEKKKFSFFAAFPPIAQKVIPEKKIQKIIEILLQPLVLNQITRIYKIIQNLV